MSNTKLTIVGNVVAKPGKGDEILVELLKLVDVTRKEKGNIKYDLHRDNINPDFFMFYETWENRELWQAHMDNKHIKVYLENVKDIQQDIFVKELTLIK